MKALTQNIHSHSRIHEIHDYHKRIINFTKYIFTRNIDVIALQEACQTSSIDAVAEEELSSFVSADPNVKITADNCAWLIVKELEKLGLTYYWTWCSAKLGYGKYDEGLAIISRYPILEASEYITSKSTDYDNWKTRKLICAKCQIDGAIYNFNSVHMGWWEDEEEPFIGQMEKVDEIGKAQEGHVLLMGDFNSPSDITCGGYDYVKKLGWFDTYELADSKDSGITVPGTIDGWEQGIEKGMRIDYIWSKENLSIDSSKIMYSGTDEPVISDHFGVCISL